MYITVKKKKAVLFYNVNVINIFLRGIVCKNI